MSWTLYKSFGLSVLAHLIVFGGLITNEFRPKPKHKKKKNKIIYISPVKLPEIKKIKIEPPKPKTIDQGLKKPKVVKKPQIKATPKPIKTPEPKPSVKTYSPEIIKKIETLRKNPYFKKWSDKRLAKLKVPPGMDNWDQAVKMTEHLDKEHDWSFNPPDLGSENDKENKSKKDNTKNNELKNKNFNKSELEKSENELENKIYFEKIEKDESEDFDIKLIYEDNGFIANIIKTENRILVTYFPFKLIEKEDSNNKEIDIKIPEDLDDEEINYFYINKSDEILADNDLFLEKVIEQFNIIEESE